MNKKSKENQNIRTEIAEELGIYGIHSQDIKSMDSKSSINKNSSNLCNSHNNQRW